MSTQQPRSLIPNIRLRVLIIGRENAGKTSILQRVCETTESPIIYRGNKKVELDPSKYPREHNDIDDELVFSNNNRYVFHNSRGNDAGSTEELKILQKFIQRKCRERQLRDRLHAIWYCVPMDHQRPQLELQFYKDICSDKNVPVVVLFTKFDQFLRKVGRRVLDHPNEYPDSNVSEVADRLFQEHYLHPLGDDVRFVRLEKMHRKNTRCDDIIVKTLVAMDKDVVALMLKAVKTVTKAKAEKYQGEAPTLRVTLGDGEHSKHHDQSSTPPSRPSFPTPPPTTLHVPSRSSGQRKLSPVRDAAAKPTQQSIAIKRTASQATPTESTHLRAVSADGAIVPSISAPAQFSFAPLATSRSRSPAMFSEGAVPVISVPAQLPFASSHPPSLSPSRSHSPAMFSEGLVPAISAPVQLPFASSLTASLAPSRSHSPGMFSGRVGGHKSDGDDTLVPASIWRSNSKRKRTISIERAEGYTHTRSRAIEAIGGALGVAAKLGHEALFIGVDLLQFAPVPGLDVAGNILLSIWDAIEMVETNRQACLRLTERCADILISIRDEIAVGGYNVADELRAPIAKLVKAFGEVYHFIDKLGQCPFLKRYLRRNEISSSILACDTALNDALGMFDRSIHIRTLKLQKETHNLLGSLSHNPPGLTPTHFPLPPKVLQSPPTDPESVGNTLHALRASQNAQDRAKDMADLHQLMHAALTANDDVAMIEVLQIARSEMPEAIKTLERALEGGQLDVESTVVPLHHQQEDAGKCNGPSVDLANTSARPSSTDTLDRKFIETGIHALRRLSKGTDLGLPSWTITRFEIDLETRVGIGSFSDVYRGTWRKNTVAVKVIAEMTPSKIFLREVEIWKSLHHPNVLELFGASSVSSEPPWFLVSKFYPRGNLVKYLKGLSDTDAIRIDEVKMIHEISKGMEYLHTQGVLHGDLKAANILVSNDTRCIISDFGQSEMRSEVYRITGTSQPRGTLRWQAPELMQGAQMLTQEMDVYAFAICCGEILTMGALPWPLMDDNAVRHSVLKENMRPSLPPSNRINSQLINIIRTSWDRDPLNRPSFKQITRKLKKQRMGRS